MSVTEHWYPNKSRYQAEKSPEPGQGEKAGVTMDVNVNETSSETVGIFPMLLNEQLLPI